MPGTIQRTGRAHDTSHPMVLTPPETNSDLISRQWSYIRDTLALRKKTKTCNHVPSIYPPSFSTQGENRRLYLDSYGIIINTAIRRMEYGDVFPEQKQHKKRNMTACNHVRVGSDEINDFIQDVVEIRNGYRLQKMFTSLVETKLLKATPLTYGPEEGSGVWRPERRFELGGQELEEFGWCFPPLASPPSDHGGAEVSRVREVPDENAWTAMEDLSNCGEPLFGTETSDAGENDTRLRPLPNGRSREEGIAKLTFENLMTLTKANTPLSDSSGDKAVIPQLDGVRDLAQSPRTECVKEIIFNEKIYRPNTDVQDIKIQNVCANAIILSPLNNPRPRRTPMAGIIRNFLCKFYLRSCKPSRLHRLSKSQPPGRATELELGNDDNKDLANHQDSYTANLDPFNEDDPNTKYLSTPFQTERYHILSKLAANPATFTPAIDIPHHPALANFSPQAPWRAPSVSYWCRPVNFEPNELEVKEEGVARFPCSLSKLNIILPYLSIQYADITRAYNSWAYRNCMGTALVDLHIAMATGVYNRWLRHHLHSSRTGCISNPDEEEQGGWQQDLEKDMERSMRHYGICISLREFSCWVAEPELEVTADTVRDTESVTRLEWAGCTITKVLEGQVDKYMDMGGLVEFINRAHEYGMGSFIHEVAGDLGLGGRGEGSEPESDGEVEEERQTGEVTTFTSPYMDMDDVESGSGSADGDYSDSTVDHNLTEQGVPWIDGSNEGWQNGEVVTPSLDVWDGSDVPTEVQKEHHHAW
ncbi:hypothetical protein V8F20_012591 [Naviculisporaceae sp. PSN 640]